MMSFAVSAIAVAALAFALPAGAHQKEGLKQVKQVSNYSIHGGNRATTENFSVSYTVQYRSGAVRDFACDETRIVKASPKAFVKGSATCQVTGNQAPAGTYPIPDDTGWLSDYEFFIVPGDGTEREAVSGNIEVIDNGDGTQTWEVTAYY